MSYDYSTGMWRWVGMQAPETIMMPPFLVVGDCWVFERMIGIYSGFTAKMIFSAPGSGNQVSAEATTDQGVFNWEFPSSQTSPLTPQTYLWTCQVVDPGDDCRYTIQSGSIPVFGDLASAGPPATTKTPLQQMLAVVDQTLLSLLSDKVQTVTYASQTYTLHNVKDLWFIRQSLANRVAEEQAQLSGNSRSNRILARFVFR